MWQVIGQNKTVSLFQRGLERGSLSHAYMLVGPAHVGKMTLALNLAQALNCEAANPPCSECATCQKIISGKHADVQVVGLGQNGDADNARTRAEISIDQIRQVLHSCSLPPFEGKYRVYIIDEAERMSTEAANCLLKTLEEPVGNVVFILLTVNDKLLPATVVSRCQRLELARLTAAEVETALTSRGKVTPEKARLLSRLSRGCLGWAHMAADDASWLQQRMERLDMLFNILRSSYSERFDYAAQLAMQFGKKRESVYELLETWLTWWHDLLLVKTNCSGGVTNVDLLPRLDDMAKVFNLAHIRAVISGIQALDRQLRQNANSRLALEVLMLDIPRISIKTASAVEVKHA